MGSTVQPFYRISIKMHTIFDLKSSEGKKNNCSEIGRTNWVYIFCTFALGECNMHACVQFFLVITIT